jgi:hypothetical protein
MFRELCTLALGIGLVIGFSTTLHSGPFEDVLSDTFCSGLSQNEKTGCQGYLQFRIARGKDRQHSLDRCLWGCYETMADPTKVQACQAGCRKAHELDW